MLLKVKYFKQKTDYSCGPACLKTTLQFFNKRLSEKRLIKKAKTCKINGTFHMTMINAARKLGFYVLVKERASFKDIKYYIDRRIPLIFDWYMSDHDEGHYSVIIGYQKDSIFYHDPWNGARKKISYASFKKMWFDHPPNPSKRWFMVIAPYKFRYFSGKLYCPLKK